VWLDFMIIGFLPLYVVLDRMNNTAVPPGYFRAALAWPIIAAALFSWVNVRRSSDHLLYWDGLLYATASMSVGWFGLYFFMGFFAVLAVLISSAFIAIYGAIRPDPDKTKTNCLRLIGFFYRNQMVQ
jgi:hypothetical protein